MRKTIATLGAAAFLGLGLPAVPAMAQGIGCEVMLCLPAGFGPSECSDAKSYFKKALRKDFDPFKPCKKVDATGMVSDLEVPVEWFSRERTSCPGGYVSGRDRDGAYRYCSGGIKHYTDRGVAITLGGGGNPAADLPGYTPSPVNIPGVTDVPQQSNRYEYIYASYQSFRNDK